MEQKEVAIQCLEKLDVYKPYIRKFKSKAGVPCFFEGYAGFYADQELELYNKIKEVEKEFGYVVYAITHEITNIGETWSMLCTPQDNEGVDDLVFPVANEDGKSRLNFTDFYAFAYVWNKSEPLFSEAGDIVVRAAYGGIKRIG